MFCDDRSGNDALFKQSVVSKYRCVSINRCHRPEGSVKSTAFAPMFISTVNPGPLPLAGYVITSWRLVKSAAPIGGELHTGTTWL